MYLSGTPFRTQRTPLPLSYSSTVTTHTNHRQGTTATLKRKRSQTIAVTNNLAHTTKRQPISNRPPPSSRASTNTVQETIIIDSSDEGSGPSTRSKRRTIHTTSLLGEGDDTGGSGDGIVENLARGEQEAPPNHPGTGRQEAAGQDIQQDHRDEDDTIQRPSRRPFNPISLDLLPRWNPFIRATLPDDSEEDDIILEADDIVERDTPNLVTARESGFFDTSVETGHEDAAVRIAAAAVYFRWHVIEETDVRLLLVLDRIQTKSPLYQVIRNSCLRHQSVYQNKAMAWYKRGVLATVEAMGGRDVFDNSTTIQRQAVWRTLFNRDPLGMAKASLPSSQLSIDMRGIYRSADPKAHKWRRFIKTCFVWMAEDTYNYRVVRDSDEIAFMNWKKMPGRRSINALDLGDCLDIPVRHGGMFDRDRRNIGLVAMNNPSFIVEDD